MMASPCTVFLVFFFLTPASPTILYELPFSIDVHNASIVRANPSGPAIYNATLVDFWRVGSGPVEPVSAWDLGPYTGAPAPRSQQVGLGPVAHPGSTAVAFFNGTFSAVLNLYETPVTPSTSLGTITVENNFDPAIATAPFPTPTSLLDLALHYRVPTAQKTGVAIYSSWSLGLLNRVTRRFVWWETAIFDLARPLGGDELWIDTISGNVIVHSVLGPPSAFHTKAADSADSGSATWASEALLHLTISGQQVGDAMAAASTKFNTSLGSNAADWLLVHTNVEAEGTGSGRMGHSVRTMRITSLP